MPLTNLAASAKPRILEWSPVVIGLLILWAPTFYNLATGIWQQDEFAHGPLIAGTILWLLWDRRKILLLPAESAMPGVGLAVVVGGLMMFLLGRIAEISIFEIGAIIPIFGGILIALRGPQAIRTYWFVLLFSIYLIPLPSTFVDWVTGPLKHQVSVIAEHLLYAAGYPIGRDGVILTVGPYQLLVADACSGINSMFSLSAIGLLYLYLMRYPSWLHNAVIVASLLPIAFVANVVRVMVLVLVTYHMGDAAGQGFLHKFSGMVLFFAALATLLAFDGILQKAFRRKSHATG